MLEQMLNTPKKSGGPGINTLVLMQANAGYVDLAQNHNITKLNTTNTTTAESKFNGSSFSFQDGFIRIGTITDFVWASNESFTIEWWQKTTVFNSNNWFVAKGSGTTSCLKIFSSDIYLQTEGAAYGWTNMNQVLTLNVWQHVAIVQAGGVMKLYTDGVQRMSFTTNGNFGRKDQFLSWGGGSPSNYPAKSYMDQLRVSNTARYTGPFTPPTLPFVID